MCAEIPVLTICCSALSIRLLSIISTYISFSICKKSGIHGMTIARLALIVQITYSNLIIEKAEKLLLNAG
jgi:hypothetical protein